MYDMQTTPYCEAANFEGLAAAWGRQPPSSTAPRGVEPGRWAGSDSGGWSPWKGNESHGMVTGMQKASRQQKYEELERLEVEPT